MKKEDFKVYSNPDIKKLLKDKAEEVSFDLEIPDEDNITVLFVSSPYFAVMMQSPEHFYYPTDLEAEETFLAPLLSEDIFWEFVEKTKVIRIKEKLLLGPLLHIPVENEKGEQEMLSIFDGLIQTEFVKFFKTAVMVMNFEAAMDEAFDDAFAQLMDGLENNGYLDQVMNNVAEILDNPEVLAELIFQEDREEEGPFK